MLFVTSSASFLFYAAVIPRPASYETKSLGTKPHPLSPDGAELDAYVLGVTMPLAEFTRQCVAVIHLTDDEDNKLIVCDAGQSYTDDDIQRATRFQEQFFYSAILR